MAQSQNLNHSFYNQECIVLAKGLLGQTLVRVTNGVRVSGRIVEVESYLGGVDAASHSYKDKRTLRNVAMYMKPATAYVYSIYGMYHCFNISSKGLGSCVLIRALEPLDGQDHMMSMRLTARKSATKQTSPNSNTKNKLKKKDLCNGPSKLCTALSIDNLTCNKQDLASSDILFIEASEGVPDAKIVTCKRVGIDSCGKDWADKPLRFYELGNVYVSVRNKKAEEELYVEDNDTG